MKVKLKAVLQKTYNRLNRTREWAAGTMDYSTATAVHRVTPEPEPSPALVKTANNTSDIRNLGRDAQYGAHPLVRQSAVARLLVEGTLLFTF